MNTAGVCLRISCRPHQEQPTTSCRHLSATPDNCELYKLLFWATAVMNAVAKPSRSVMCCSRLVGCKGHHVFKARLPALEETNVSCLAASC